MNLATAVIVLFARGNFRPGYAANMKHWMNSIRNGARFFGVTSTTIGLRYRFPLRQADHQTLVLPWTFTASVQILTSHINRYKLIFCARSVRVISSHITLWASSTTV